MAVLLGAQPALASLSCDMGASAKQTCVPECGVAMSLMGDDCPMPSQIKCGYFGQSCCNDAQPPSNIRLTTKTKSNGDRTKYLSVPLVAVADRAFYVAPSSARFTATGPPRYILLQVFRV
jgi:hypothetical protein